MCANLQNVPSSDEGAGWKSGPPEGGNRHPPWRSACRSAVDFSKPWAGITLEPMKACLGSPPKPFNGAWLYTFQQLKALLDEGVAATPLEYPRPVA